MFTDRNCQFALMTMVSAAYCIPLATNFQSLPPFHSSTFPPFHPSTFPPFHPSTLPPFHSSTFPPFHLSTLPPFHPSTFPPFHSSTFPLFHPSTFPPFHLSTLPQSHTYRHIRTTPASIAARASPLRFRFRSRNRMAPSTNVMTTEKRRISEPTDMDTSGIARPWK